MINNIPKNSHYEERLKDIEANMFNKPEECLEQINDIFSEDSNIKDADYYLEALRLKASINFLCGHYNEIFYAASDLYDEAVKSNNLKYMAKAYGYMGIAYYKWDNQEISYHYSLAALEFLNSIDDPYSTSIGYVNLADLDQVLTKEERIHYLSKGHEIAYDLGKMDLVYESLKIMAEIYLDSKEYDNAIFTLKKILKYIEEHPSERYEGRSLELLSLVYFEKNDLARACDYNLRAKKIFASSGHTQYFIRCELHYIDLLIKQNHYQEALEKATQLLISKELNIEGHKYSELFGKLSLIHELLGHFREALEANKTHFNCELKLKEKASQKAIEHYKSADQANKWQDEKKLYKERNQELKKINTTLRKVIANSKLVSETGKEITSSLELDHVLNLIYKNINENMHVSTLVLGLYDKDKGKIDFPFMMENSERVQIPSIDINNPNSITAWALRENEIIHIADSLAETDHYLDVTTPVFTGAKTRSIIVCPLMIKDEKIGIISIQSTHVNEYTSEDLEMTKSLASFFSIALKNSDESRRLTKEIERRRASEKHLKLANSQLKIASHTDELTNIHNRRWLMEYANEGFNDSIKSGKDIALMMIDIDHFKEFNDHYGHIAGDNCLIKIATIIKETLQNVKSHAIRYGGNEFIVLLEQTNQKDATQLAHEILQDIIAAHIPHEYSNITDVVTATIGAYIGQLPEGKDIDYVMHQADQSLYRAKDLGRNQVIINYHLNQ